VEGHRFFISWYTEPGPTWIFRISK
jgi:hypothetical protein